MREKGYNIPKYAMDKRIILSERHLSSKISYFPKKRNLPKNSVFINVIRILSLDIRLSTKAKQMLSKNYHLAPVYFPNGPLSFKIFAFFPVVPFPHPSTLFFLMEVPSAWPSLQLDDIKTLKTQCPFDYSLLSVITPCT